MDLDETPKDLNVEETDKLFESPFENIDQNQTLRMPMEETVNETTNFRENRTSNPYLFNSPPVKKEEIFDSLDKFDQEDKPDKDEENFG